MPLSDDFVKSAQDTADGYELWQKHNKALDPVLSALVDLKAPYSNTHFTHMSSLLPEDDKKLIDNRFFSTLYFGIVDKTRKTTIRPGRINYVPQNQNSAFPEDESWKIPQGKIIAHYSGHIEMQVMGGVFGKYVTVCKTKDVQELIKHLPLWVGHHAPELAKSMKPAAVEPPKPVVPPQAPPQP